MLAIDMWKAKGPIFPIVSLSVYEWLKCFCISCYIMLYHGQILSKKLVSQGEMYFVQFDPCKPLPWGALVGSHW